jgi:PTH1 family peptidyl-tRNA hydrolase
MDGERETVWLVVGLGNPGRRYEGTYHNLGRLAAVRFASRQEGFDGRWAGKHKGRLCKLRAGEARVFVLLPETYMNLSGESVSEAAGMYKIGLDRIVVVHDDLDLEPGVVRIKKGGGDGGHRGVMSCILSFGSPDFIRVKIGIGRDPVMDPVDYVLSRIRADRAGTMEDSLERAADAVEAVLAHGLRKAMNDFNRRQKKTPETEGNET